MNGHTKRYPAPSSRVIRVDRDVYTHILTNKRPGESIQSATTRLVNEALEKE